MAEPADFDDWDEDEDFVPSGAPQAGIVAAATANFIAGGLSLIGGGFLAVRGVGGLEALAQSSLSGAAVFASSPDILEKIARVSAIIASPLALGLMLFGLGAIIAGIGVAKRLAWGRGLSFGLAVAGTILGLLFLLLPPLLLPFVLLFGCHALVIRLVLSDKDYEYQFR